jgi:hypothetical protein
MHADLPVALQRLRETGQAGLVVAHYVGTLQVGACHFEPAPNQQLRTDSRQQFALRSLAGCMPDSFHVSLSPTTARVTGGFRQDLPSEVLGGGCERGKAW